MDESSTEWVSPENLNHPVVGLVCERWDQVLPLLPADLEQSARQTHALQRRRGIRAATDLLRIVLVYAVLDLPLRLVAAWCVLQGLADISDVAILQRLRHSRRWLGTLLAQVLQARQVALAQQDGVHLRLRDATVVSRPGSRGADWRVHLSYDLGHLCVDGVEVTTASGGETLARLPTVAGAIEVADRGYAFASSLGPVLAAGGDLVVRINWQNLPLWRLTGQRLDIIAWLQEAFPDCQVAPPEVTVWLATPQGRYQLRLLACRIAPEAAERARHKARAAAQKKGRTPDARTLFACAFILVITSLPAHPWPAASVLNLYRFRWQVELLFKRLKSLLHFDALRAQDPHLAQTYLLGKLLAALLIDALSGAVATRVPDWLLAPQRPLSIWRLTTLLWDQFSQLIRGVIPFEIMLQQLPKLRRFLCEPPRRRLQQLALARLFLARLSVVNVPSTLPLC